MSPRFPRSQSHQAFVGCSGTKGPSAVTSTHKVHDLFVSAANVFDARCHGASSGVLKSLALVGQTCFRQVFCLHDSYITKMFLVLNR